MTKPLCFIDVDGVICPFADGEEIWDAHYGKVRFPSRMPALVQRLAAVFEMNWSTAWMEDAHEFLGPKLGLGEESWPVLQYQSTTDLKLPAIIDVSAGRPFVWIDDDMDFEAGRLRAATLSGERWPDEKLASVVDQESLLIWASPNRGLTDVHVRAAEHFANQWDGPSDGGGNVARWPASTASTSSPTDRRPS